MAFTWHSLFPSTLLWSQTSGFPRPVHQLPSSDENTLSWVCFTSVSISSFLGDRAIFSSLVANVHLASRTVLGQLRLEWQQWSSILANVTLTKMTVTMLYTYQAVQRHAAFYYQLVLSNNNTWKIESSKIPLWLIWLLKITWCMACKIWHLPDSPCKIRHLPDSLQGSDSLDGGFQCAYNHAWHCRGSKPQCACVPWG